MLVWDYLLSLHCAYFKAAVVGVVLPCERYQQSSPNPQGAEEWQGMEEGVPGG